MRAVALDLRRVGVVPRRSCGASGARRRISAPQQRAGRAKRAVSANRALPACTLSAQRIGDAQPLRQRFGEALDRADLHREPHVVDAVGEGRAIASSKRRSLRRASAAIAARSGAGALGSPSISTLGAVRRQNVLREIDAVEIAVVLAAVLQMIDDLQRRAERVIRGPGRARSSPCTSSTKRPTGIAE